MAQDGGGDGFAFSISAAGKKPTRKIDLHERDQGPRKEVLTGIGPDGGLQSAEPAPVPDGPKVIPSQPNTYRTAAAAAVTTDAGRIPKSSYVPSFIPAPSTAAAEEEATKKGLDTNFEGAAVDTAVAQQEVTYGLIHRHPKSAGASASITTDTNTVPVSDTEVLKRDLAHLPQEASLEAYQEMPVEAFGEALLRGMGWTEGRAIGRGQKKEVTAKDVVRRPHRLGLGAAPAPPPAAAAGGGGGGNGGEGGQKRKIIKPGEKRETLEAPQEIEIPRDDKGRGVVVVVRVGKKMVIEEGRHRGLQCVVESIEESSKRASVVLLPSQEVVNVHCRSLGDGAASTSTGVRGEDRNKEGKKRRKEDGNGNGREGEKGKKYDKIESDSEEEEEEDTSNAWLVSNIRVKIIDKRLQGGNVYLKKGVVVDVKTPTLCDVLLDGQKIITDVRQRQLETVVPKLEGTPVLVLLGKFRGRVGRLLKRNSSTGLAAVQFSSDLSVHKLYLDDIAEYTGDDR